jgi:hypothetical protein
VVTHNNVRSPEGSTWRASCRLPLVEKSTMALT